MSDCDARIIGLMRDYEALGRSRRALADWLGVSPPHISRALNDDHLTPTLRRALIRAGLLDHEPRRRFACDLDDLRSRRLEWVRQVVGGTNAEIVDYLLDCARVPTSGVGSPSASLLPEPGH